MRKNSFIQSSAVVASLVASSFACKPLGSDPVSRTLDTSVPNKIYVALMNTPSTKDAAAFKLVAYSAGTLDPTSVKFCFDTAAACAAGTSTLVQNGIAQDAGNGRKVFLSERFIKLAANLNFIVVAKDSAGASITQPVQVVSKGSGGATTGTATTGTATTGTTTSGATTGSTTTGTTSTGGGKATGTTSGNSTAGETTGGQNATTGGSSGDDPNTGDDDSSY